MAPHSSTFAWKIPRTEEPGVHGVAEGWTRLSNFTFTFHFNALEKEMATHSSVLAWRIPGTAVPGGLPSMGSRRVGHNWKRLSSSSSSMVCIVKPMVFPVVMYRCESWIIKKAECQRINSFELWCWGRLFRVPWTARRSNQSILKEIRPGCSLEEMKLKLKLQYFGHLM